MRRLHDDFGGLYDDIGRLPDHWLKTCERRHETCCLP